VGEGALDIVGEELLSRFSGVRLWAVITLQTHGRDRSVKVSHEIMCDCDQRAKTELMLKVFLANVNSRSRSLIAVARPSVVCLSSVVCNVRAPYSGG